MQNSTGHRRRVQTCLPCYNKKQKCDRRYPCGNCTRRRRPEDCIYDSHPTSQPSVNLQVESQPQCWPPERSLDHQARPRVEPVNVLPLTSLTSSTNPSEQEQALLNAFGYSEYSSSNTFALLKKWNSRGSGEAVVSADNTFLFQDVLSAIGRDLERMPHRRVLDLLIQYFITELNWLKQLIHAPTFLTTYQQWWLINKPLSAADVDFAVLILRIASYATYFLPARLRNLETITPLSIPEICSTCEEIGNKLAHTAAALDRKPSLSRVQHLLFAALIASREGKMDRCWELVGAASQVAQERDEVMKDCSELDKELWRRLYCNLYLIDSHLSRRLDRASFLPDALDAEQLPRMRLLSTCEPINADIDAPEMFTERLLQVRLTRFWRNSGPRLQNAEYDPIRAEQMYEGFCSGYVQTLPPAFALNPDTKWDTHSPKLILQRRLLHLSIFDSICTNFRPLLLLNSNQITSWPAYKLVLLHAQKKLLAMAAFKVLDLVSTLTPIMNDSQKHAEIIIFYNFEASVILLHLCTVSDLPNDLEGPSSGIFGCDIVRLSRNNVLKAVERSLDRLRSFAGVSPMAAVGSTILSRLTRQLASDTAVTSSTHSDESCPSTTHSSLGSTDYDMTFPVPDMGDFGIDPSYDSLAVAVFGNSITHPDLYDQTIDFNSIF